MRRVVAAFALAFWLGGLTFYATVVIPVGTEVLGGTVAQGFVTQRVTERLNWVSLVALTALAWNVFTTPRHPTFRGRNALAIVWGVMAVCQIALFVIHPFLDRLLDTESRHVLEHARFYAIHRAYLLVTSAQWVAGIAYFVLALRAWRMEDQA